MNNKHTPEGLINKRNSLKFKGVLALFHHLFYNEWSQLHYDDITIHGVGIVNQHSTKWWHILIALSFLSLWRFTKTSPHIADAMLCVGLALLLYKVQLWDWLRKVLEELGKHGMNMFLVHAFIFYFLFSDYICFFIRMARCRHRAILMKNLTYIQQGIL